jgi:SAM-dependent methyltransferase
MQRDIFRESEGNEWFGRNSSALEKLHAQAISDPSTDAVLRIVRPFAPKTVLEIGASNGWRLDVMHELWGADVHGIEPSADAVACASPSIDLCVGTADELPHPNASFDCVVYGFCLYLCDRALLPKIVSEGDRVLKTGGLLVVYDFAPAVETSRAYHHLAGVTSFKRDHAELWRMFGYELVSREDMADEVAVSVLRKTHLATHPVLPVPDSLMYNVVTAPPSVRRARVPMTAVI